MDKHLDISFRPMTPGDWYAVANIYKEGIDTGNATFTPETPTWEEWNADHLEPCRIVAEADNNIVGWAALLPVSNRDVFRGVAELSIYIANNYKNKQVGSGLMKQVIAQSEKNGFWLLQSGIFPENKASIHLHEKSGFRIVGYREKIGEMNGIWRDIVFMERRSKITGI